MLGIIVARGLYSGSAEMIIISVALFLLAMILTFLDKKFVRFFLLVCLFFAGNGFYFLGMKSFDVKSYSQPVTVQGRVGDHVEDYQYGYQVILDYDNPICHNLPHTHSSSSNM